MPENCLRVFWTLSGDSAYPVWMASENLRAVSCDLSEVRQAFPGFLMRLGDACFEFGRMTNLGSQKWLHDTKSSGFIFGKGVGPISEGRLSSSPSLSVAYEAITWLHHDPALECCPYFTGTEGLLCNPAPTHY